MDSKIATGLLASGGEFYRQTSKLSKLSALYILKLLTYLKKNEIKSQYSAVFNLESVIKLILASSSSYRKALLERLQLNFTTESPNVNEQRYPDESIQDMVIRLAEEKAMHVASRFSAALVIGSDQAVECDGVIIGKPGDFESAKLQLLQMSGKSLFFHTGLCVLNTETNQIEKDIVDFKVTFRSLSTQEIESYLNKEQPYNCAGSFKSEQLGISLLEKMEGNDPTALIGLPLIRLCEMLRNQGIKIP